MTFKEISTWILLVLFVWLGFSYIAPILESGSFASGGGGHVFGFIIAFVVLFTIAHIALAIFSPKLANEAEDERDRRIELYGERAGAFALGAATVTGLAVSLMAGDRLYANIFFLGLVGSEIVKAAWQVFLYRRTA